MSVLKVGQMPCGTKMQIENWHGEYGFLPKAGTLAAYPVATVSLEGQFSPKRGRKFRASFNFDNEAEAEQAFNELTAGTKQLKDFINLINDPRKIECL